MDLLPAYDGAQLAAVSGAFLLAGVVKGVVGFGLPIVIVALLANVVPITDALALVTIPALISNIWMIRWRQVPAVLRRFRLLMIAFAVGVAGGAAIILLVTPQTLLLIVGVAVVTLAPLGHVAPKDLLEGRDTPALDLATGLVSGVLGGATTVLGPPIALYLSALRLPRADYMCALGTIWSFGILCILVAFGATDIVDGPLLMLSTLAVVPTYAGFKLGALIGGLADERMFRLLVLGGLVLGGFRMILSGIA